MSMGALEVSCDYWHKDIGNRALWVLWVVCRGIGLAGLFQHVPPMLHLIVIWGVWAVLQCAELPSGSVTMGWWCVLGLQHCLSVLCVKPILTLMQEFLAGHCISSACGFNVVWLVLTYKKIIFSFFSHSKPSCRLEMRDCGPFTRKSS